MMSRNRRTGTTLAATFAFLALAGCEANPVGPGAVGSPISADGLTALHSAGHGGPKGSHLYQLNIIGVSQDKTVDMTGNNGRRIFVPLDGSTRIYLAEGDDFEVLDANGTDGRAEFQMPDPGLAMDPETLELTDAESAYSVFVRGLGKPGGKADITTCAEVIENFDLRGREARSLGPDAECSVEPHTATIESVKGNRKFQNVTAQLLTLQLQIFEDDEPTGIFVLVPIFDENLEGVFWEYENSGLKLAQLRFYPCSTVVSLGEPVLDETTGEVIGHEPVNDDHACFSA